MTAITGITTHHHSLLSKKRNGSRHKSKNTGPSEREIKAKVAQIKRDWSYTQVTGRAASNPNQAGSLAEKLEILAARKVCADNGWQW